MLRKCFNTRVALLLALAASGFAGTSAAQDAQRLAALATAVKPDVVKWRRDFHQHPELGNRETRTAERVARHLRGLGMKVETGVAHTGVVAVLQGGKPGPRIALRADMDALPVTEQGDLPFKSTATAQFNGQTTGVMHACGHDGHTAILMGVAQALAAMKADLPGSVLFVFQPAEEGAPAGEEGGAAMMLKQGVFERHKPDAVLGLHLRSTLRVGTVGVRSGPVMAESDSFKILVKGRQTHGAVPWGGVDPVLAASQIVTALQGIVSRRVDLTRAPAVISVGMIRGGIRYNIVPEEVELLGTIRTFEIPMRDAIYADLRRVAENTAIASGASATVEIAQHTGVLSNDAALTARLRPALEIAVGTGNVLDIPLQTIAEDFAAFADRVPGLYFFVGSTPAGQDPATAPSNHSPQFFVDEGALDVGVRALLGTTVAYLQDGS